MRLIPESKAALVQLSKLIAERRVIPLVGSGTSAAAGYPTWSQLLDGFHERARRTADVGGKYLGRLKKIDEPLWRAEEYRRLLGEREFTRALRETFRRRALPATSPLHALCALGFRHYLTTNYDGLIEQALRCNRQQYKRLVWGSDGAAGASAEFVRELASSTADRRVVYLHGRYDDPRSFVLADGDYFRRYVATDETQKRLFAVFLTQSILFVGFSMSDPELAALLRIVRGFFQQVTPWHFAIMPLPEGDSPEVATAYYQYRYGMTPIFYEYTRDHEGLRVALDMLKRSSEAEARTDGTPSGSAAEILDELETEHPDDPNKGKFGRRSSSRGWSLEAEVEESGVEDWFRIQLTVRAPDEGAIRDRRVKFHLHPSFRRSTATITLRKRRALLERYAYGAFTVGVVANGGRVKLELDLAELKSAPHLFRAR